MKPVWEASILTIQGSSLLYIRLFHCPPRHCVFISMFWTIALIMIHPWPSCKSMCSQFLSTTLLRNQSESSYVEHLPLNKKEKKKLLIQPFSVSPLLPRQTSLTQRLPDKLRNYSFTRIDELKKQQLIICKLKLFLLL